MRSFQDTFGTRFWPAFSGNSGTREKAGQSPFAETARRVLRTEGDCPPFSQVGLATVGQTTFGLK